MEDEGMTQNRRLPAETIRALWQQAASHHASGDQEQAIAAYSSAIARAQEFEEFELATELLTEVLLIVAADAPEATHLGTLKTEIQRRNMELVRLIEMEEIAQTYKTMGEQARLSKAVETLGKLSFSGIPKSIKATIHYSRTKALCLAICYSMDQAKTVWLAAIEKIQDHPHLYYDPEVLESMVAIHLGLSGYYVAWETAEKATNALHACAKTLRELGIVPPILLTLEIHRVEILEALEKKDYTLFDQHAENLYRELENAQNIHPNRRLMLSINLAAKYLAQENLVKALKWVGRAYQAQDAEVAPENWMAVALMDMACSYKREDWDRLGAAISIATHLMESRKLDDPFSKAVLTAFRQINSVPSSAPEVWRSLKGELETTLLNHTIRPGMEVFEEIQDWIRSQ